MSEGRNIALDGVRGLAALSVALGHCLLMVSGVDVWGKTAADFPIMPPEQITERLLFLLFPSNAAVMVFFVLSGHVLWASFARKRMTAADFPDYLLARLFRLLPLVVVSAPIYALVSAPPMGELLANMLLLSTSMNGVLWSLQTEMAGSLVIFLVWLASRDNPLKLVAALCLTVAAVPFCRGNHLVVYLPAFVLGALTHHVPAQIWRSRALLCIALALLLLPSLYFSYRGVTRVFEIIAATAIVGFVAANQPAALATPIMKALGAISYPLYVIHPLGVAVTIGITGQLADTNFLFRFAIFAIASVGIAAVLAWLLHVTVEMPALRSRPRLSRKPIGAPPAI